jgi:CO/xanthine dehydrogenase Mo-binding subunit
MSPEPQKPKLQIKAEPEQCIIINQPIVRNFSTGGGHGPEDTLTEGDLKLTIKKWQGYPPDKCRLIGKPTVAMPEVMLPRLTGKAMYATRVVFPNMLVCKMLGSPHPRAIVKSVDTSKAEKMPGVAYVLTAGNGPKAWPITTTPQFQGEVVAIVAAETEDQAEDAIAALDVEYEVLPFASSLQQAMAPNPPDLSTRVRGNVIKTAYHWGDVEKALAQSDIVKEFTYFFAGAIPIPFQPIGSVAKWDGDKLTVYGMGQAVAPLRNTLARQMGMAPENVRYINKWNGGTFGGAMPSAPKFYPWMAYISKQTNRPVKITLNKAEELAHLAVKPQTLCKFKVGAMKDGKILGCRREFHVNTGANPGGGFGGEGGGGRSELYLHVVPNWEENGFLYRTNSMNTGPSRSNYQQEFKWAWEQMMDEMAEACQMDPMKFRLLNVQKPGTKIAIGQGGPTIVPMPETEDGFLTYDDYAVVEILEEGAKVIGWDKRNPVPGGSPGRFKRGMGLAMSQHHAGRVGYQEGEPGYDWIVSRLNANGGNQVEGNVFQAFINLDEEGHIILHFGQPDSGTNHGTTMSMQVAEILGYTNLNAIRLVWGDTDSSPESPGWHSGMVTQLQGGALNNAADKLRKELLKRASETLKVDAGKLETTNGVISVTGDPKKSITFAELAKANKGVISVFGKCTHPAAIGRSMNRGIGCCFAEVEVDTWTGDYRYVRAAYCHDAGHLNNPLLASADMHGSLIQSTQMATDAIPWDREFPGTRHYAVGYLSYRLPTIMEPPDTTNVFINSWEPRWFFGSKGFAETAIGAPPGALANAIYNACGVRIREHPITKEGIMAGLKANGKGQVIA